MEENLLKNDKNKYKLYNSCKFSVTMIIYKKTQKKKQKNWCIIL